MTGTVFLQTLRESISRRMGIVLLATSLIIAGIYVFNIGFEDGPRPGLRLVKLGALVLPAEVFVKTNYDSLIGLTANLWLLLGLFAVSGLTVSYLERGWVDLVMSKGVPRWQVLLERYLASVTLFIVAVFIFCGTIGLWVWWGTGFAPWKFYGGVGLIILGYAAILALMTLVSIHQTNAALLMMLGFLTWMLGNILAGREKSIYLFVKAAWARFIMDWLYRILPKSSELRDMGSALVQGGSIESWFPVWSTALFLVACLTLACWLLHRKSF